MLEQVNAYFKKIKHLLPWSWKWIRTMSAKFRLGVLMSNVNTAFSVILHISTIMTSERYLGTIIWGTFRLCVYYSSGCGHLC